MEPPGPQDPETRTIIDKLAEFVARNGTDFEAMTKQKQLANPKFGFLYGGEHYNYYKHRVCMEQRLLEQQYQPAVCQSMGPQNSLLMNLAHPPEPLFAMEMRNNNNGQGMMEPGNNNMNANGNNRTHCPPPPMPPTMNLAMPPNPNMLAMQIEGLNVQQNTLKEQIQQSEQNLQAQHTALMQQQQKRIDEMLPKTQMEHLQNSAKQENIDLAGFDQILQPIIDSCTKDSIGTGKSWILKYAEESTKSKIVLQYLLQKALDSGEKFSTKLHLIYLVNDVLHHCARKNVEDLKMALENIVIPMFCSAQLIASEGEGQKLTKLLSLWESKANFFDACVISKLRCPESSMEEYHHNLASSHSSAVNALKQTTQTTFDNYQQQHQAFVKHATQQIATWEGQKQSLEQQQQQMLLKAPPNQMGNLLQSPPPKVGYMGPGPGQNIPNLAQMEQPQQPSNPNLMSPMGAGPKPQIMENILLQPPNSMANHQMPIQQQQPQIPPHNDPSRCEGYLQPPPKASFLIPDLSKPPPGFGAPAMAEGAPPAAAPPPKETVPASPYFDLPAGLMAPFIRLEDCSYRALIPALIVLPPPTPPSERLINAVESFYSMPSHDRPRDGDGWEKLALYEYYKVKNQARKQKEEAIAKGMRDRSRSPSPVHFDTQRAKKVNKRRYRSESRSPVRDVAAAPTAPMEDVETPKQRPRARRHSRDRRADSPPYESSNSYRSGSTDRSERSSRSRQRDLSPPTPGIGFSSKSNNSANNSIDESNKGHQMLLKMGWAGAGTGLGATGQGIDKPIEGGAIRDRQDVYKGVGMNLNDPYENFRKNKGVAFITRMKARADDKV